MALTVLEAQKNKPNRNSTDLSTSELIQSWYKMQKKRMKIAI